MRQFEIRFMDKGIERTVLEHYQPIYDYSDQHDGWRNESIKSQIQDLSADLEICDDPEEITLIINGRPLRYKRA
jgi:hypothetical protein